MNAYSDCQCNNSTCICSKDHFDSPSFLDPGKLKEGEDKIISGETVCNVDSPEDCENCGS